MDKVVEFENMSEEDMGTLTDFLRDTIRDAEVEEDWRESENTKVLPLLRGLVKHLMHEYLGEDYDGDPDEERELDF